MFHEALTRAPLPAGLRAARLRARACKRPPIRLWIRFSAAPAIEVDKGSAHSARAEMIAIDHHFKV